MGVTPKGHKLWTEAEYAVLRQNKGNYREMCRRLRHRTRAAIYAQCQGLGLRCPQHVWTAAEISRLRKLYATAPIEEICRTFPFSTWAKISRVARYHGLRRRQKDYKITGIPALDDVRRRCYEIGWTMRDLDGAARTGTYFQRCGWIGKRINHRALGRAIEALDGVVQAQWRE